MEKLRPKSPARQEPTVATICCGNIEARIYRKVTPSGYQHHDYRLRRVWNTAGKRRRMSSEYYSAQDESHLRSAITEASKRCRELDTTLSATGEELS